MEKCLFLCSFLRFRTANAAELIVNGGFVTGDFTGWTAVNNSLGELIPHTVAGTGVGWFGNTTGTLNSLHFGGDYSINKGIFL